MIRYLLLTSVLALSACQSNRLVELDYQPIAVITACKAGNGPSQQYNLYLTLTPTKAIWMPSVCAMPLANN